MPYTQCTWTNASPHPAATHTALLVASCHLPSPALWLGRALQPDTAVGLSSGARGAGDLDAKYPLHYECTAASRRHPRCADWDIMPSPSPAFWSGWGL